MIFSFHFSTIVFQEGVKIIFSEKVNNFGNINKNSQLFISVDKIGLKTCLNLESQSISGRKGNNFVSETKHINENKMRTDFTPNC